MAVRRAGKRAQKQSRRDDGLATTPTQYGSTSPDYAAQAGDSDWMKSYSEEQIGMMGGRARMTELAAASEQRAADRAGSAAGETAEVGAVPFDETGTTETPTSMSEGPTSPPTTYGIGEMPKPGVRKQIGQGKAAKSGKLQKRIARTTGTSRGEAKGLMKKVRKKVRRGNTAGGRKTITRALSGGKSAGVPRSPQRSKKAAAAAKKITKRIDARQTARTTTAKRRKK